jgi:hypothetical protein
MGPGGDVKYGSSRVSKRVMVNVSFRSGGATWSSDAASVSPSMPR